MAIAHFCFHLNAVLAFWIAYILTRPLGASLVDYLAQDSDGGGLVVGTTWTSALFLLVIVGLVSFLTITRRDEIQLPSTTEEESMTRQS